jgi:hypothetical protein
VHYEGWSHFKQGRDAIDARLAREPAATRDLFQFLPIGVGVPVGS